MTLCCAMGISGFPAGFPVLQWWRCCGGGLCCTPPPKSLEKRSLLHSSALCIPGSHAGGQNAIEGFRGRKPLPSGILGALDRAGFGVAAPAQGLDGFTCTKNRLGATGCVLMKEESIRLRAAQPPGAADYFFPLLFFLLNALLLPLGKS